MFNKIIKFENFSSKKKNKKIIKILDNLINRSTSDQLLKSLTPNYNYSFIENRLKKFKREKIFKIIGMGGSILGAEAIYNFLKCKKKFYFINNLQNTLKNIEKKKNDKYNYFKIW
tara:strand:- start:2170 stop:2514 length:345 start_codon:yes stop_codon:yes gene_type:complete